MRKIAIISLALVLVSALAADVKVDWAGKLYNQLRWTTGASGYGAHTNIFAGRDNERFGNFVRSEAEFEMNATVSKYVKVYLRMKTIFDSDDPGEPNDGSANASAWQTYWTDQTGWFKLRGFRIDFMPPFEYVDVIGLGTPMGLRFSKWFMADRRYIDRDNSKGVYIQGHFSDTMKWNLIRMWQPDYLGYNWGNGAFKAEDATWALNINNMFDNFYIDVDGVWYIDVEFDPEDIDNPNYNGEEDDDPDGTMSGNWPYMAYGFGLSGRADLNDAMAVDFNIMMTGQTHDADIADGDEDNIVDDWADWWPSPMYASVMSPSGVVSFMTTDPFDNGFSPNVQFFYIHHNYVSYWGSRREHDLLLIDGGIDGIRDTYGARLGLNTFLWGGDQIGVRHYLRDNDFLRLGEGLVESPVGYWGGTFDFIFDLESVTLDGQFNYLGATDNTGGDTDKEDPNWDGEGDLYMPARDYSGMVAGLGAKTTVNNIDLGIDVRYGMWQELGIAEMEAREDYTADDHKTTAIVIEPMAGYQITPAMNVVLKPRYQIITDDYADGESECKISDIVISHKWVYNFGGFDFWLRAEHLFRTDEYTYETGGRETEEMDFSSHTIHAAWEVKF